MTLYTKSITARKSKYDGDRICIMRNPKGYEDMYNSWIPQLAPSQELRDQVKRGIGWDKFKGRFEKELEKNRQFVEFVAEYAQKHNVTLMCIEDNPNYCHRSLVAEAVKRVNPKIKIKIK